MSCEDAMRTDKSQIVAGAPPSRLEVVGWSFDQIAPGSHVLGPKSSASCARRRARWPQVLVQHLAWQRHSVNKSRKHMLSCCRKQMRKRKAGTDELVGFLFSFFCTPGSSADLDQQCFAF